MKKSALIISLTLSLLYAKDSYSVDDLIIQALKNAPDIKIASSKFEASTTRTKQANSSYLPSVDLHLEGGIKGMNEILSTTNETLSDSLLLGNISLKQLLYDFGKTSSNVASYKYESNALNMSVKQDISNKKREVKVAYYDVLKALALIEVHQESVKLNEKQLYRSQKYFSAGIRTKIDISDAKVQLIKAKMSLKTAQYNLKNAFASLDKVIGITEVNQTYNLYSKKLDFTKLFNSLSDYPMNLEKSIEFAYENRFNLKEHILNVKVAKAKKSLSSADYYPSLYFGANYLKQNAGKFKNSTPQNSWKASVNLDWNLYHGGLTDAKSQEKRVQIVTANEQLNNAKLQIKKATTNAFINVSKVKDNVSLSQALLEVSDEKFNQAQKRYEHGLSDYIELQQSRQGYIDAKANLIVSYYEYYQSIAKLDNAIGK